MNNDLITFAILGGDLRQTYLSNYLAETGHIVNTFKVPSKKLNKNIQIKSNLEDAITDSNIIIGPLPCSSNNKDLFFIENSKPLALEDLFSNIKKNQIFIAGALNNNIKSIIKKHNIQHIDLLKNENLAIANAITTLLFPSSIFSKNTLYFNPHITFYNSFMITYSNNPFLSIINS